IDRVGVCCSRVNSSIDLLLARGTGLPCQIILTPSYSHRAQNIWIPPVSLNPTQVRSQAKMLSMLGFMFLLLLRMELETTAMVFLELISQSPRKAMDLISCVSNRRP
ncbi:hypothetical protein BDW62DRAFT_193569, partial [Aspergillus aurantiobrunneus]